MLLPFATLDGDAGRTGEQPPGWSSSLLLDSDEASDASEVEAMGLTESGEAHGDHAAAAATASLLLALVEVVVAENDAAKAAAASTTGAGSDAAATEAAAEA